MKKLIFIGILALILSISLVSATSQTLLWEDTFTRSDSATVGNGWVEVAYDIFSISSNELYIDGQSMGGHSVLTRDLSSYPYATQYDLIVKQSAIDGLETFHFRDSDTNIIFGWFSNSVSPYERIHNGTDTISLSDQSQNIYYNYSFRVDWDNCLLNFTLDNTLTITETPLTSCTNPVDYISIQSNKNSQADLWLDSISLYNDTSPVIPVNFTVNNTQDPLDLTITDMEGLIVNTSITTNKEYDELNNSYTSFNYYINTSLNNNCARFENQVCTLTNGEIISLNMTKINNTYFTTNEITDINIFPVYSPYTIESVATSTKQNYTIYKNNHLKFKILNYTTIGNGDLFTSIGINFDNLTQDEPLNTYYCNSTYTTGNPSNLDECDLVQSIFKEDFFTHFHNNTKHTQIPIHPNINTTQLSYLIFTSEVALSSNGWEVAYYTDDSYNNDSFEIGSYNAWGNTNNIFDIHLHQLYQNDSINYYTSFNDGSNNITNSTLKTDYFNVTNFAPFGVSIYDPCDITYTLGSDSNTSIYFNWSETTDFNNDPFIQNVSIHPVGVLLEYDLFTVNNGTWEYNYITDKETFLTGEYKTEILLTDNFSNSELSESTCTFNICLNNWDQQLSTCTNSTQLITYTDLNNCPLQYDLPVDNGTSQACVSPTTGDLSFNAIILIMGIILILIIVLWLIIKNPLLGIVSFVISVLMTFYIYENATDGVLFLTMLMLNLTLLLLTLFTFFNKK